MELADDVLWETSMIEGLVPQTGFGDDTPTHVRRWIRDWLRLAAEPCDHLRAWGCDSPLVVRAIGWPDAWCPSCAPAILERLEACGHCGTRVLGVPHGLILSLAGTILLNGMWCNDCWTNGDTR